MSRKYSVLFVALAFVVAMAAGAWAWTIPTFSGADQTDVPNTNKIDIVGVSADHDGSLGTYHAQPMWASRDFTSEMEMPFVVNPTVGGGGVFSVDSLLMSPDSADTIRFAGNMGASWDLKAEYSSIAANQGGSVDALLAYVGRATRSIPFVLSQDVTTLANPYSVDLRLAEFTFDDGSKNLLYQAGYTNAAGISDDAFKFAGTPCSTGECDTFFNELLKVYSGDIYLNSEDKHLYTYAPCGDYEKEWQIYPNWLPCSQDEARSVHPFDMVRYSADVKGSHALDLGYYVVERNIWKQQNNVEFIVERVLNKSGNLAVVEPAHFDWLPLGERYAGAAGFRTRSADYANAILEGDAAYLLNQDWDTNRVTADGKNWFSWINTADESAYSIFGTTAVTAPVNLPSGFARYYAHSADTAENLEMCFTGNLFCEELAIASQIWSPDVVCACSYTDNCFTLYPMSADSAVVADLATWTGISAPEFVADHKVCSSTCEGYWDINLQYYADLAPWTSLRNCGDVCQAASFDVVLKDATCNDNTRDIFLARVVFELRPFRVCDEQVRLDIATALGMLTDPVNKPAHLGPIDAFLNNAAFDASLGNDLDIVVVGPDGRNYELSEMAKATNAYGTNTFMNASADWQGVKNYFEVWPQTRTQTVYEAWGNGSLSTTSLVDLSFYVAIVNGNAPEGELPVQAKKGYFLIYAGENNNYTTFFAAMANFDINCSISPTPTPVEPEMTVTSTPSGTTTAATCSTFTKESFSTEAWAAILTALGVTDESAYTIVPSGVDCLTSDVAGLTAGQSVAYTVTYDDGIASAGTGSTGRMVFVYNVTDGKYDVLPEVASEVSIATEQTKNAAIAEGSAYDANEAADALQVGFSLVSVTATPVSTPTTTPSSGGGSGCSFGFAPLALLLLAPLALLRK